MKLVIGGTFQGKLAFAREHFGQEDGWIDGCICGKEELFTCRGIFHFHEYVKRLLQEGKTTDTIAEELIEKNPDCIIVTNELGLGIVPVAAFDREYREATGRICTKLAAYADEVYRVICGNGQVIKGA